MASSDLPDPADRSLELLAEITATADGILQELTGFRAEVTAHLGAQDTKLDALASKVDGHGVMLVEILRRLPSPADR